MTMDLEFYAEVIDGYLAEGQLSILVFAVLSSVVMAFAVIAVFFFLGAVGLYRLNRQLGNKFAWLAFIPGFSGYALGAAADGLKKRKPSNYCIHMLMLNLFYVVLNAIYYCKSAGRFIYFYEKLASGAEIDTLSLLEATMVVDQSDMVFYLVYYATTLLSYAVTFVSLLCFMRILRLYRRGGFFLILGTIFVPQVMDVYLFAMRNAKIYPKPPVFRMPDGTLFGEGDLDGDDVVDLGGDRDVRCDESDSSDDGYYSDPEGGASDEGSSDGADSNGDDSADEEDGRF